MSEEGSKRARVRSAGGKKGGGEDGGEEGSRTQAKKAQGGARARA